jgi:hypothetical protein
MERGRLQDWLGTILPRGSICTVTPQQVGRRLGLTWSAMAEMTSAVDQTALLQRASDRIALTKPDQ